ncbi:DUF6090 family protein [Gaetbulibacter sp. M240]|uniref:DUF6090 family protein n=1 Tax=Gaetbulibacter sp. M240 TaxID=3126511 RepID=UPI00374E3B35
MIKFFRKIRYKLIEKNKTGKYLKYAIGEIFLVVIGILIALSINNWNEQRKAQQSEIELLNRILIDLQIDENRINDHIQYYKKDQSMHNHIYLETQGTSYTKSIIDLSTLRSARTFDLIIEANFSNFTKEIEKNTTRENIYNYFKFESNVNDALEHLQDFKENNLKPFLSKNGINDTKELFKHHQLKYFELREKNIISYSELKKQYGTLELDQMLYDLGIKTSWVLTSLDDLLKANKAMQLSLKSELNTK